MVSIFTAVAAGGILLQSFSWQLLVAHGGEAFRFFGPKWVALQAVATVAMGLWLVQSRHTFPHGKALWGVVLLFAASAVLGWAHGGSIFWQVLAERLALLALFLFFYQGFAEGELNWSALLWPALLSAGGIAVIGLSQVIRSGLSIDGRMPYFEIGSTMGHANNTAQWIAALMALSIPNINGVSQAVARRIGWFLVALCLAYVILLRARSICLVFLVWGLIYFRSDIIRRRWNWGMFAWTGGVAAALVLLELFSGKASAFGYRWSLWFATFPMVFERPLGWGTGQFEFSHIPYLSGMLGTTYETPSRSAHNELLRVVIEEGIFVAGLLLCCGIYFLRKLTQMESSPDRGKSIALMLTALFVIEGLTQFPFQNPWMALPWALLLAWTAAAVFPKFQFPQRVARSVGAIFLVMLAFLSVKSGYSLLYGESDNIDSVSRACAWQPANWRACRSEGFLRLKGGDVPGAKRVFLRSLNEAEHNYFAQRGMMEASFREGNKLAACFWINKQNKTLGTNSPFRNSEEALCKSFGLPSR